MYQHCSLYAQSGWLISIAQWIAQSTGAFALQDPERCTYNNQHQLVPSNYTMQDAAMPI